MHKWNGLIGKIKNNDFDLIITDMTITPQRAEAVDFTIPFMKTGAGILYAPSSSTSQEIPFQNIDELVNQDQVKYGVIVNSTTHDFIRDHANTNDTFKKMIDYWEKNPDYLVESMRIGIYRIRNEEENYAFMTDVVTLPMLKEEYPTIMQIGDIFKSTDYVIVLPKSMLFHEI